MSATYPGFLVVLLVAAYSEVVAQENHPLRMVDRTAEVGLSFRHHEGTGEPYLFELMSAGLASFDYDNDGAVDVYFLNGNELPQSDATSRGQLSKPARNGLFRTLNSVGAPIAFQDVSVCSRAGLESFSLGVAAADFDEDGFTDLYVTNYGQNSLLRNNGDGTFSDHTATAGVGDGEKFGAGAVFLDVDLDGDLDLFSGNYVQFTLSRYQELKPTAFPFPPGPKDFEAAADSLFRNDGNARFTDVSSDSGIQSLTSPSMGAIAGDFDLDGDSDIFVCCDGTPDVLFAGDGDGNFVEEGVLWGLAYDAQGNANGSMGVDAADLNGDGIEDLLVTDYVDQMPMLFISQGPGFFQDETRRRDAGRPVLPHVNWGVGLIDFDNDGDRDILYANGHFLKKTDDTHPQTQYAVANTLLENSALPDNTGQLRFQDRSQTLIGENSRNFSTRGAVFEDFDDDGRIDAMLLNCGAEAQFLHNKSDAQSCWIRFKLIGRRSNRSAVGARVIVSTANRKLAAEVHSGRGYQSDFGKRLHFGLGELTEVPKVTIRWPSGTVQTLRGLAVNQTITLVEPTRD